MKTLRTVASAALAIALSAMLAAFYCAETFAPPEQQAFPEEQGDNSSRFHELDRLENALTLVVASNCLECHISTPHVSDKRTRAFLNMHLRTLDCTVCHLGGKVTYVEVPKPGVEPPEFVLTAMQGGGKKPVQVLFEVDRGSGKHLVSGAVRFEPKGADCKRCHRRGSTILRAMGRYEGYRRRILEDLEILLLLKGGG